MFSHSIRGRFSSFFFFETKETYCAEKKKTSHVAMGRKGRKNCLVIGMSNAMISNVAAPVLTRGPGAGVTDSEKMPKMMSTRY